MTTKTEITPATKSQLDALIEIVKDAGMNEAAGLLQLGSSEITKELKVREQCACYEYIGDNPDCPIHGDYFKSSQEFSDSDIRDRADIYCLGMGC